MDGSRPILIGPTDGHGRSDRRTDPGECRPI